MYKKTSRVAMAAAAVLALAFGTAQAAQPDDAPQPGGPGMHQKGWHGHHGGGPFGVIMKLHDQLKLNASQEQQWQAAIDTMKQGREAMRKSHEQMREQFKAQQNQPILDLSAMHAARQQAEQQNAQLREQTSAAWLAFYNGLNDQQKTTVSTALKQQFARMEQRHEKMKQHWQQHRAAKAASAPAAQ
ncbi:periplasmic heavy metal sensor [Burkholderia stagnalis]